MKMRNRSLFSSVTFGLIFTSLITPRAHVAANEVTLQGIVRDTSDNILPGVAIAVIGTNATAVTDENGKFSFSVTAPEQVQLELSKEGYLEAELSVSDPTQPIEAALAALTDDTGLIRHTAMISMSHSLIEIRRDTKQYKNRPMTDELYQEIVSRYGEKPAEEAVFRIYLPPRVPKINGLLLISEHGVGGAMMEHDLVREFADRHHVALIGVLGNAIQRGIYPASALDSILVDIADRVNHPEITSAPVFTFGHSNGTGFSASYAAMRPDRVIGWVSFHSGGSWHLVFPGVENVPGLVMHGNKDSYFDQGQAPAIEDLRVQRDAPVALLVDGEGGHWPRKREATFALVLAFYESCLRIRVDGRDPNITTKTWPVAPLKPAVIQRGWLGSTYDRSVGGMQKLDIARYNDYQGDRRKANWLPDETFAEAWQNYGETLDLSGSRFAQ
ncbi:carboxypeptidase regulatory-like domain-containing protein [Aporhodopirellula aestuarii]|uniref:Carboxypeptidase regulatory-like domain-containing protein n=1 Tax=Aporhodopirellula aestuarii TaxID=2950107 RepID=A0ABT0UAT0_9BACT|nr:carboxypeptidase regulatory-like domain-containing protein [Aporhodopirellula aestuarii]MCM2373630.1 carboxypeptidase regulatory-like domain-containing protein [Aporhodopirellula aestuarii]